MLRQKINVPANNYNLKVHTLAICGIHINYVIVLLLVDCGYRIAPNFRDKNFVIATFFRDYHCAAASVRTIHIVALPTIACGSAFS